MCRCGSTLQPNGAGVRYKFVIKVYTAGLHIIGKATTPVAVLAAPGPKRMHVVMLRDIDVNELGRLLTRGMQDNAPREEFSKSIAGTLRMADIFSAKKKLVAGDTFFVDWVPGVGTSVVINGKAQGEPVKEPQFLHLADAHLARQATVRQRAEENLLGRALSNAGGSPGQK